jgi:hypothetical protein
MQKVTDTIIGAAGISSIEVVNQATMLDVSHVSTISATVIQIIIGIVTLLGLFRKKQNL